MITLFTILFATFFSIEKPAKTACQGKLEELNYTYDFPLKFQSELEEKNEVNQEIFSTLNCFKIAAQQDTQKIMLMTVYRFRSEPRYSYRLSQFGIKEVIENYKLPPNHTFFINNYHLIFKNDAMEGEALARNHIRIELVEKADKRLDGNTFVFDGNHKRPHWLKECKICPF